MKKRITICICHSLLLAGKPALHPCAFAILILYCFRQKGYILVKKYIAGALLIPLAFSLSAAQDYVTGAQIAKEANAIVGTRYVWGGNSNTKGLDCSALVKNIYRKHGYTLPRKASWQIINTDQCPTYTDLNDAELGDALYFRNARGNIHHTAIVSGFDDNGEIIMTHAKGRKFGVVREIIEQRYKDEFCGFKRFSKCTSPLKGEYTEEEVASAIIFASKEMGVSPETLFEIVNGLSGIDPMLITIRSSENRGSSLSALMMLHSNGIAVTSTTEGIEIRADDIDKAQTIIEMLYSYGFRYRIGLMQVFVDIDKNYAIGDLVYPYANFEKAGKQTAQCIKQSRGLFGGSYDMRRFIGCYLGRWE